MLFLLAALAGGSFLPFGGPALGLETTLEPAPSGVSHLKPRWLHQALRTWNSSPVDALFRVRRSYTVRLGDGVLTCAG